MTSRVIGIDLTHHGLPCRADATCHFIATVHADTAAGMSEAIAVRDGHELGVHQYVHQPTEIWTVTGFAAEFSHHGRSTMKRKR